MAWKIRHEGSPQARATTLTEIVDGLRDGLWEATDEVQGPGDSSWVAIENHPQLAELAEDIDRPVAVHSEEDRVDMNALIDVCLVLLIFFMMTATFAVAVQKTVPLPTLPEEKTGKKTRPVDDDQVRKHMVRVNAELDSKGKPAIRIQGQKFDAFKADGALDADKLRDELQKYTRDNPPREEMLLDARGVSWGLVVAIQDAARSSGIRFVHYLVDKK